MFAPPESFGPAASGVAGVMASSTRLPDHLQIKTGLGAEPRSTTRRNSVFSWEQAFSVAGTLFASAIRGSSPRSARVALLLVRDRLWRRSSSADVEPRRVRERPDFANRVPNPLVPGVRRVLRNRVCRLLLSVYLIGSVTGAIPGTLMPYFVTYVLEPEAALRWISLYLFCTCRVSCACSGSGSRTASAEGDVISRSSPAARILALLRPEARRSSAGSSSGPDRRSGWPCPAPSIEAD
jgi:hypothetical protein